MVVYGWTSIVRRLAPAETMLGAALFLGMALWVLRYIILSVPYASLSFIAASHVRPFVAILPATVQKKMEALIQDEELYAEEVGVRGVVERSMFFVGVSDDSVAYDASCTKALLPLLSEDIARMATASAERLRLVQRHRIRTSELVHDPEMTITTAAAEPRPTTASGEDHDDGDPSCALPRARLWAMLHSPELSFGMSLVMLADLGVTASEYYDMPKWQGTFITVFSRSTIVVYTAEIVLSVFAAPTWRALWRAGFLVDVGLVVCSWFALYATAFGLQASAVVENTTSASGAACL